MSTARDEHLPGQSPIAWQGQQIALVDLLDRVLAGGVVISGEITLCIADIDLVRISLRALVASVRAGWDTNTAGGTANPMAKGNIP
ncbi:MAG: gas vesicle protein [Streptomycetaceae bacterium]|nr:gas vesicle protein [Streptomycetaceae bacterium]